MVFDRNKYKGKYDKHQHVKKGNYFFNLCFFINVTAPKSKGGAIYLLQSNFSIESSTFQACVADYGGSIYSEQTRQGNITKSIFTDSKADYFGSIYIHSFETKSRTIIDNTNISKSLGTKYISAIRVEGSNTSLIECIFTECYSECFGVYWDWNSYPSRTKISNCLFQYNKSEGEGSCITFYHYQAFADLVNNIFISNTGKAFNSIYIYSIDGNVTVSNCIFSSSQEIEIGERYPSDSLHLYNCLYNTTK
ncbi:hypothetical protein TVAG_119810 [Trichomonas vaginalis G3]|uniref:Right handed beta helix domain-containing protein n=1 Tax=Trichomonas vaginalis (strain ATCC PRA-98 / G3) TaxID=412133 RepID=A2D7C7_TRIV3|nr:pectin lyase-like family [Trichomonas vaginalis G3]EAY23644.1 hypothetical protein TVAG_119810 [Trichomonas vaginalis G3]KAI5490136.1 pectin lyase-like family [Trichomonas vaginalis G3]|eukprot:XP_001276892.1 hypothetical protein [Trichomonas vaginalis G3]